jgi:hypothetical protein
MIVAFEYNFFNGSRKEPIQTPPGKKGKDETCPETRIVIFSGGLFRRYIFF